MANSCLWTLWTCVIFVPNQQSLRLASSSTWSRGFFFSYENPQLVLRGKSSHSLRYGSRLPPLGHSSFSVCVYVCVGRYFPGKIILYVRSIVHSRWKSSSSNTTSHIKTASLFSYPWRALILTHNFERKRRRRRRKKMKATLKKKKEMYDCKIMSRISSSLRFIPLFPLWEN